MARVSKEKKRKKDAQMRIQRCGKERKYQLWQQQHGGGVQDIEDKSARPTTQGTLLPPMI